MCNHRNTVRCEVIWVGRVRPDGRTEYQTGSVDGDAPSWNNDYTGASWCTKCGQQLSKRSQYWEEWIEIQDGLRPIPQSKGKEPEPELIEPIGGPWNYDYSTRLDIRMGKLR